MPTRFLSQVASSSSSRFSFIVLLTATIVISVATWSGPVRADESPGPWECSGYSGDAHTRCLQAFIDMQREKISKLEGELKTQQGSVSQLKEQVDRQSAATQDLQRQLSDTSYHTAPSVQTYFYPPVGLGLYLGSPWYYGSPYFYRPYFGPRAFFGPRYFFGPRHFRHCHGRC
jgi:hypothetical protein